MGNELAGRPSPEADIMKLLDRLHAESLELSAAAAGPAQPGTQISCLNARRAGRHHLRGRRRSSATSLPSDCSGCRRMTMDYDLGDDAVQLRQHLRKLISNNVPADFLVPAPRSQDLATTETFCKLLPSRAAGAGLAKSMAARGSCGTRRAARGDVGSARARGRSTWESIGSARH